MLFGQPEPEPVPEEAASSHRRRYLIILGMVIALILAGGSAAYLILSSNVSVNRGPQGAPPPPLGDTTAPAGTSSPDAAAAASAAAGHSALPSRNPSTKPGGGGGPGAPGAVTYRVNGDLCPAMDLSPVVAVATGPGQTGGDHTDKSNYVDYTCSGGFGPSGKVRMNADVRIFADATAAQAAYATDKVGTEHVGGVGTDATGFLPTGGGYSLLAVDANMEIKVSLVGVGGSPTPGQLRQPAIDTVTKSLPRLRG